jgi:hypothetical protein
VRRLIFLLIIGLSVYAGQALAQRAGNLGIAGRIPEVYAITSGSGTAPIVTLTLHPFGPRPTDRMASVKLRSNAAYKLTIEVASVDSNGIGTTGNSPVLSDVGLGVVGIQSAGANISLGHFDTITDGYDFSQNWPNTSSGAETLLIKTLANISGPTQILSGNRISARGNLFTSDNFVVITLGVANLSPEVEHDPGFSTIIRLRMTRQ